MKAEKQEPLDPWGVQPLPVHGDARPDPSNRERTAKAKPLGEFFKTNWVEHEPQSMLVDELLAYVESTAPLRGTPMDGRRLSEHSNAGKSRMIGRMIALAAERRAEAGLPPNPHQLIYVELERSSSLKVFFREVLKLLGDDHWNDRRAQLEELEDKVQSMTKDLGVEALIGDEIQHLDRKSKDATQISDKLKSFLNRGIVPLILVGDETSEGFFKKNPKFASRLGIPLELKPLNFFHNTEHAKILRDFCDTLDADIAKAGFTEGISRLGKAGLRTPLAHVSGGHVGRVCRVVQHALNHAILRGSPVIEAHDLSVATRRFAAPLGWIGRDPFSRPAAR